MLQLQIENNFKKEQYILLFNRLHKVKKKVKTTFF